MGEPPRTPRTDAVDDGERRKAFDALAEASADGIIMLDDDSIIQYANPAVERILGYTPEELVDATIMEIIPERLRDVHAESLQRYLDTDEKHIDWTYVELPGLHKDGHEVPLAISINEFEHDGDHYFVGTFRDISHRKEVEQKLGARKKELRTLIRLLPVGVIVADSDGELVEANEAAKDIWGGFVAANSIADYEQYTGWWPDTGEPVAPDEWPLACALRGEEVTDPDVIDIEGFDGERRTIMVHAMPIRDDEGNVQRAVITMTDITERQAREEQLENQNEQLDRFASMLAHELRNPLEIAQIYLDFLDEGDDATLDQIANAHDRMDEIIEVLLVLARGQDDIGDREPVGLTGAVKEAWANTTTGSAEIEVVSTQTLYVNPAHLQHLLENLFRNAIEHSNGAVTVRVGAVEDGFYVEDTGAGIPEGERKSVTEPGYSTDANGVGMGLTFVTELADTHCWEYTIAESDEGGARFEFTNVDTITDT